MKAEPVSGAELAASLLEIGAVVLRPSNPFTWASGLESPIYCDNRMTLGHPDLRAAICAGFAAMSANYTFSRVAGTATAGIPHAAWLADALDLPMCYVRSGAKKHGRGNQIEGPLDKGDSVLLIEDLVSTGMSSLAAVHALQDAGATVPAVLAIFSYGIPMSRTAFRDANMPLHTLTTFQHLLEAAEHLSGPRDLGEGEIDSLRRWHRDPKAWSDAQVAG
jgi:orotate phosphoribosyltransferase